MKDESSQFDTLPRCLMLCRRIHKSSMGHPTRPTVKLRIEKFDQSDHIRRLLIAIVPLELWISFHSPPLHFSVREMNLDREKIRFRRRVCIRDGQWVFQNRLYRTPDADHLVAVLEKLCCFIRKMVADSGLGSGVRWVDVDTLDRTTVISLSLPVFWRLTDGVVKDAEPSGTRPTQLGFISYVYS